MARKTFNEKLQNSKNMPKIEMIDDPRSIARYGGERMLIAPPVEYDEIMKRIPTGKVITTDRIRAYLAKEHSADFTCPLTAGIFVNIAAHASVERSVNADQACVDETPYWRTLKKDGELNEKYPDGIDGQKLRLEMEGHTVAQKGKRYFVEDFEEKLFEL